MGANFRKDTQAFLNDSKTIFEVPMIATKDGNVVDRVNPLPVGLVGPNTDAFGRLRISEPFTLFDSSHRFADNGLFHSSITGDASATFSANEGLVNLTVGDNANNEIIRETTKCFSYQPGKSLLILNTFVMNAPKTGLRQRVGYYGDKNGIYFEQDGTTVNLVERNFNTGTIAETRKSQSEWNGDKLDGTGLSKKTLDVTKAQILYIDMEWLGLGSVRCGFIIDGQIIIVHTFHHANLITSTYITTASLPIRYEIKQQSELGDSSTATLKQVCSTVISEGGYELRGKQQAIGTTVSSPKDLPSPAGTFYPVVAIKLKASPNRLDAIVILTALSMLGVTNNAFYNWQVRVGGSITEPGSPTGWISAGSDSAVEYKLDGVGVSGTFRTLASGFFTATTQASVPVDILKEALFKFQLERNSFTSTPEILYLAIATNSAGADVYATLDWEEISR
jgi:hypothetical protein